MKIEGKNIVLTGANSGIGYELMKALLFKGNRILAVDLNTNSLDGINGVIPMGCDISLKENVDAVFERAEELFGKIDVFIANAGIAYFESMDYSDWDRIDGIYRTNVFSPIYAYQKYVRHLDGRDGVFGLTDSAMGLMGMPGYTLYTSTKFALNGFRDAVRHEKPRNLQITVLYPVATDTKFFLTATGRDDFRKPYPMQAPQHVAKSMVSGLEKGRAKVYPCRLFRFAMVLFAVMPFTRKVYLHFEKKKFEEFKAENKD